MGGMPRKNLQSSEALWKRADVTGQLVKTLQRAARVFRAVPVKLRRRNLASEHRDTGKSGERMPKCRQLVTPA